MGFLDLFRRAEPIAGRDAFMDFLDTQAAFLAQKGMFEYSRARAGPYGNVLFSDAVFLEELEKSRWVAFPVILAMVSEALEGALRPAAGDHRDEVLLGVSAAALAILLREEGLLERSIVYASDVSPEALERAEQGIYELDRVAQFSASYAAAGGKASLSDYYTAAYGAARFDPALRANVVFTDHSLATDHVFAEVQLVTCRNVLIYFDAALQNRAVGLFRDALCHKGFLGLGLGETLRFTEHAGAFEPVDARLRLYRKR